MNRAPTLSLSKKTDLLCQLSLVLLLLCAIAAWIGIDSRSFNTAEHSTLVVEQNSLAIVGYSDSRWVRPGSQKNDDDDNRQPTLGLAAGWIAFAVSRSVVLLDYTLAVDIPRSLKYRIPVPRAPPLA